MNCLTCNGELEMASGDMYGRCKECKALFMNVAGNWQPYAVDDSIRGMIEQSLGFAPSVQEPVKPVPVECTQCGAVLERVDTDGQTITRCPKCGILSSWDGNWLMPIIVDAPGGGWNPEFQAIFEEKLGFTKKVRTRPPGVPE